MRRAAWLLLVALVLVRCGTLSVALEQPPTPDPRIDALATRVAALESQVSPLPEPTSVPPDTSWGSLAYVQGGDIWVRALPEGEEQRLTTDGRNRAPRWSPSGAWIAFTKDDDVWLMRADATSARRVPDSFGASWSPTADRLAYLSRTQSGAWLIEAEALGNTGSSGRGRVVFVDQPGAVAGGEIDQVLWRPDGGAIALTVQRWQPDLSTGSDEYSSSYNGIWTIVIDDEPQAAERFAADQPTDQGLLLADWTPDTEGLLFWYAADLDTDAAKPTLRLLTFADGATRAVADVAFESPAMRSIARTTVVVTSGARRSLWEAQQLRLVDPYSDQASLLTDDQTIAFAPRCSPDGASIAYVAQPRDADFGQRRIWISTLTDPPQVRQLTNDPAFRDEHPRWSADASVLMFARLTPEGRASIWMIGADGGQPWEIIDELTPAPNWNGDAGLIAWDELLDWWVGPPGE